MILMFGTVCEQFFIYNVQVYFNDKPRHNDDDDMTNTMRYNWRLWRLFTCRVSDVLRRSSSFYHFFFTKDLKYTHAHDRCSFDVSHFIQLFVDIMCYLKWCVNLPGIKMKIIFYYIIRRLATVFYYYYYYYFPRFSIRLIPHQTSKFLFS